MDRITVFMLLAFLGISVGSPLLKSNNANPINRIAGGVQLQRFIYPYQVSFQYKGLGHFCGGSILNRYWIVTAADCVMTERKDFYVLYVDLEAKRHDYSVQKVLLHSYYKGNNSYNVAIVKINGTMDVPTNITTTIITPLNTNTEFLSVELFDWNHNISFGREKEGNKARHLRTKILDRKTCLKFYPNLPTWNFCSFSFEGGACIGDVGAPIVVDGAQVGFVSRGSCKKERPDVNILLSEFMPWIEPNIKN